MLGLKLNHVSKRGNSTGPGDSLALLDAEVSAGIATNEF